MAAQQRYGLATRVREPSRLLADLITNIGFQQLAIFRCASALHRRGFTPAAMVLIRLLRHLYAAELNWATDIAPGIALVHGNGLVISREARIDPGWVLSQNVTIGVSRGPLVVSEPLLEADVHIGPGAVLIGPIVVGPRSKIAANCVVMTDLAPGTVVTPSPPVVRQREDADRRAPS